MINKYSTSKNLLILFTLLFAVFYSIPNLYQDVPAVSFDTIDQEKVLTALKEHDIKPVRFMDDKVVLLDSKEQLKALEAIKNSDIKASLTLVSTNPSLFEWFGAKPLNLGLDLRGGVHIQLQADIDAIVTKQEKILIKEMQDLLKTKKIRFFKLNKDSIGFLTNEQKDEALYEIQSNLFNLDITSYQHEKCNNSGCKLIPAIKYNAVSGFFDNVRKQAIEQTMETIRKRVDEMGVSGAIVFSNGDGKISVDLPGILDVQRAKDLLGKTATLEFRLQGDEDDLVYSYKDYVLPLSEDIIITGDAIVWANAKVNEYGKSQVQVGLSGESEARFNRITKENIGKTMAVLMIESKKNPKTGKTYKDHKIISAANIQSALGDSFVITGLDAKDAEELAILLRTGAMPTTVEVIEETTLGPSLGADNIQKGIYALIMGLVIVSGFMIFYYKGFGVIANIALCFNLFCLTALLGFVGVTLTLAGIAAIVLTLGMAVDANVLIYERIKEELQKGKAAQEAIFLGFDKAFIAIFDANATTLIVGLALLWLGSGPIQAFAITLILGLITSIFTSVVCTRAMVNFYYGSHEKISLAKVYKESKKVINFYASRWFFQGVSLVLVLASLGLLYFKGLNFGIDFSGGTQIQIENSQAVKVDALRKFFEKNKVEATVQNTGSEKGALVYIKGKADPAFINLILKTSGKSELLKSEYIGPQIGKEITQKGLIAIFVSIVMTMLYIAVRFEYRLSISSSIALMHDPIVILGIFSLFGISFDLKALAAILAVIGYSLNDTIVVFDRARENFLHMPKKNPVSVMNASITQTLSRTLITSVLTFLALLVLYLFGGESLEIFALCMILGVIVGTYSSIFIAGSLAISLGVNREYLLPKSKPELDTP